MALHNITWKGTRLRTQSYNVLVGDAQLELKRCYRNSEGTPVVMLPGFLQNTEVFLPRDSRAGLAPFLAAQGYDVYLLELRGKGNSWPSASRRAKAGLHEAVCEDIPNHLGMIEKLRPGVPQFWLGQGLGSLLLAEAYARIESLPAPLLGMIHFSAARCCTLDSWPKTLRYQAWLALLSTFCFFKGYVAIPFLEPVRRESRNNFATYLAWQRQSDWVDPVDKFNCSRALASKRLPPSLYLSAGPRSLWGSVQDCRLWIQELGDHDGRLVTIGKSAGNSRNYNAKTLLSRPEACDDHFQQLLAWLEEHNQRPSESNRSLLAEAY